MGDLVCWFRLFFCPHLLSRSNRNPPDTVSVCWVAVGETRRRKVSRTLLQTVAALCGRQTNNSGQLSLITESNILHLSLVSYWDICRVFGPVQCRLCSTWSSVRSVASHRRPRTGAGLCLRRFLCVRQVTNSSNTSSKKKGKVIFTKHKTRSIQTATTAPPAGKGWSLMLFKKLIVTF